MASEEGILVFGSLFYWDDSGASTVDSTARGAHHAMIGCLSLQIVYIGMFNIIGHDMLCLMLSSYMRYRMS